MAGAVARSTPLMEAAKRANLGAAKLLLEAGATGPWRNQGTVALVDSLGRSALHYAALSGGTEDADALAEVRPRSTQERGRRERGSAGAHSTRRSCTEAAGIFPPPAAQL